MFKKILKQITKMSRDSSDRRRHHRRSSSSDRKYYGRGSSSRGYKRNPLGGSKYYKRKGRSSS
ncbi:hypothetical protein ACQCT6_01995 [Cytobacillus gottheilii]|uniref:hypothetical protein n=1 Tax=Cytobacillus gottheilii TaxID=859144 RepID=UPI00082C866F|nr:hypothetical protein [Cytobacillus gottheilii]